MGTLKEAEKFPNQETCGWMNMATDREDRMRLGEAFVQQ